MISDKKLGIYMHIPFCRSRCHYCGFYSVGRVPSERFADAIIREIETKGAVLKDRCCDTVYLGGGTPSSLTEEQLERIMTALHSHFHIDKNAEITMEMNPCDMNRHYIEHALSLGINRVSIGVQTNQDKLLKEIGRRHSALDAERALGNAYSGGFRNISIDLMCELPGQTVSDFERTLKWAVHLSINHLSVYSLILEEGTRFWQLAEKGMLTRPSENDSWAMYQAMCRILPHYGFERYEISSFARKGFASKHNLKYWKLEDYVGIGPSACSRIGRERVENLAGVNLYEKEILSGGRVPEERTLLSCEEEMEEFCFLGLRMSTGIDKKNFLQRYGKKIETVYGDVIRKLMNEKMIVSADDKIYLTYKGTAFGNYVFEQFLLS